METVRINVPDYSAEIEAAERPASTKKKKPTKAELAAARKKAEIDFKKLEMKSELERELKLSKATVKKYRQEWEDMCKDIKLKEMREELLSWQARTERLIKQKDEKIASLIDDIHSTEEMHKKNFSTQLQIMDFLKATMEALQDSAKLIYETEVKELLMEFYDEIQENTETQDKFRIKCENFVHAHNVVIENQMSNDYEIFLDKRDDRVNTEIEKRYRIRNSIVKKMKALHKQLLAFLDSLTGASPDPLKYERIGMLIERQKNYQIEARKLTEVEMRQTKLSNDLQREMVHTTSESNRKIKDLRLEHSYFVQMRKNLEKQMLQDRQETHEKLKIVTTHTFHLLKKYRKLEKQGELLLSLMANCRKFQTEAEKVVPWGDFQPPLPVGKLEEIFKIKALDLKSHIDLTDEELDGQLKLMSTFWRRQALVEAQYVLLTERKRELIEENQSYKNKLKSLSHKVEDPKDLLKVVTVENVLPPFIPPVPVSKFCLRRKYRLGKHLY